MKGFDAMLALMRLIHSSFSSADCACIRYTWWLPVTSLPSPVVLQALMVPLWLILMVGTEHISNTCYEKIREKDMNLQNRKH